MVKQIMDNLEDFILEAKASGIDKIFKKVILEEKQIETEDGLIPEYVGVIQLTARRPVTEEDDEPLYLSFQKLEGTARDEIDIAKLQESLAKSEEYMRREIQKMYPTCRIQAGVILP